MDVCHHGTHLWPAEHEIRGAVFVRVGHTSVVDVLGDWQFKRNICMCVCVCVQKHTQSRWWAYIDDVWPVLCGGLEWNPAFCVTVVSRTCVNVCLPINRETERDKVDNMGSLIANAR